MKIRWILISAASISIELAACGATASGPPNNKEILSVYTTYWNTQVSSLGLRGANTHWWPKAITPISTTTTGTGITRDTPQGKMYQVDVVFQYKTNMRVAYKCWDEGLTHIMAIGVALELRDPRQADAEFQVAPEGTTVSCTGSLFFVKVDEGWLMIGNQNYLIKR